MLGKDEVKRQSVLFEVFKSEKDYVTDLELVQEVCLYLRFLSVAANNCIIIPGLCRWSPERRPTGC